MSWFAKEQETPFDRQPLAGLFFVDGDTYSVVVERENRLGLKYPKISFPSGRAYEVYEQGEQTIWVRLFGAVALPLFSDRDTAFRHVQTLITPPDYGAYFVHPFEKDGVLIWGKTERERMLVSYDPTRAVMRDIEGVGGEAGAYRIRGQTYHLP